MKSLVELRAEIDQVDSQLITLLQRRLALVTEVGVYKKANNLPPLDAARWQQVVESRLAQARAAGVDEGLVKTIYEEIHRVALEIEAGVEKK